MALLRFRFRELPFGHAALNGILFAVDRRNMRWILIEIRSPDTDVFAVGIDPFPQIFSCTVAFGTCLALYAHDIGRQPVAIATAETSTVV
jgi:hypothetical protein